jgi:hypothetical protein
MIISDITRVVPEVRREGGFADVFQCHRGKDQVKVAQKQYRDVLIEHTDADKAKVSTYICWSCLYTY